MELRRAALAVGLLVLAAAVLRVAPSVVDICPEVKVLGLEDSDLVGILEGCLAVKPEEVAERRRGVRDTAEDTAEPAEEPDPEGDQGEKGAPEQKGEPTKAEQCDTGPQTCNDLQAEEYPLSGWHTIYLPDCQPLTVLCDMHTDGGGWTVIQRRSDGSVDFYRDWAAYKQGFGTQLGEFWLGNDNIHNLTAQGTFELRVDLVDFEGNRQFAKYRSFKVGSEEEKYKLVLGAYVEGTAGDSLTYHHDHPFSTKDQDNDLNPGNCAERYRGAWWYKGCHSSNLNALYLGGPHRSYGNGVSWMTGRGFRYSYKVAEMKVRPV